VNSIACAQGKFTSIYDYRERMYEYYRTDLGKNQVKKLGISKKIYCLFLGILEMDKKYH
jgi:hypothetical protein